MKKFTVLVLAVVFLFSGIDRSSAQEGSKLGLDDCIKIGLKGNYSVRSAVATYKQRQASKLGTMANFLPSLSFSFGPTRYASGASEYEAEVPVTTTDPVTGERITEYIKKTVTRPGNIRNNYGARFNLNQNLFDWGVNKNQYDVAASNLEAADFQIMYNLSNAVSNIKQRYYQLLKANKQLEVYQEAVKLAEEQLARSESMHEVGSVALVDVLNSKVNLGNQKVNLINQQQQVIIARNQLNIEMGRNPNTPLEIADEVDLATSVDLSLEDAIEYAFRSNPNIKRLETDYETANLNVKIAKKRRLPTIGWNGSYSRSHNEFERLYDDITKDFSWNISAGLNWTIFSGFQRTSDIRMQEASRIQAEETLMNTKKTLASELTQYYNNLVNSKQVVEINNQSVVHAEENLRLEQERYRVGAGTFLEYLNAQYLQTSARINLVRSKYDAKIAEAQFEAAIGKTNQKYFTMLEELKH